MNYKTITISLTLTLTISYIGLTLLYAFSLTDGLNSNFKNHNNNNKSQHSLSKEIVNSPDNYSNLQFQKEDWESKLSQATAMLSLINEFHQTSNN